MGTSGGRAGGARWQRTGERRLRRAHLPYALRGAVALPHPPSSAVQALHCGTMTLHKKRH
ncbi:MAG: hypothetical protein HC893_04040 [Chloroflexaceae bacterium]|nr:hypothetical protein [Chloroflexaceae bacterium]